MDSSQGSQSAQRVLAAIVFTDVVGFSRISSQNEAEALKLVQRDHRLMAEIITRHQGLILNTMGDGLLIRFDSAVEAIRASIEMQQALHDLSKTLQPREVLKHRIGCHLGDVMVDGTNVMGDGVNVAARLQAAAKPGGICLSKTIHDVAKNKVRFNATYLGPRALKNIPERVSVYEIPPPEEAEARRAMGEAGLVIPTTINEPTGAGKIVAFAAGGVAVVALLVAAVTTLKPPPGGNKPLAKKSASQANPAEDAKGTKADKDGASTGNKEPGSPATSSGNGAPASGASTPPAPTPPTPAELAARLLPYLGEQFAGISREAKFNAFISAGSSGKIAYTVYGNGKSEVVLEDANDATPQPIAWSQLDPTQVVDIATELAKRPGISGDFQNWLLAYRQVHGIR